MFSAASTLKRSGSRAAVEERLGSVPQPFYCVNNLILASGMGLNPYQTHLSNQTNKSMVY